MPPAGNGGSSSPEGRDASRRAESPDGPGSPNGPHPSGSAPGPHRPTPLLLVLQGRDLRVLAATGAAAPALDAVNGRSLTTVFPHLATDAVLAGLRRVLATGQPVTLRGERLDLHGASSVTEAEDDVLQPYDLRATPVPEADGTVRTIVLDAAPAVAEAAAGAAAAEAAEAAAAATDEATAHAAPAAEAAKPEAGAGGRADWELAVEHFLTPPEAGLSAAAEHRVADAEQRYAEARDVISAVQDELLPLGVPVLPTIRLAATYLPAGAETSAGGDWFEAIRLPNGQIGLAVGDVVGHGMTASTAMGQLRVLLRERLMDTGNVASTLGFLDRAALRVRGASSATVCLVIINPETGFLEYSTAGHPPPLITGTNSGTRYLSPTGGAPLGGAGGHAPGVDRLGPGELLLLYTDGLLERPGCTLGEGIAELAETVAAVQADEAGRTSLCSPGSLAERTVRRLIDETGFRDDITVLAAQLRTAPDGLDLMVPAEGENLATMRAGLGGWLDELGIQGHHAQLLQHAVGELAANAIEHAYLGARRPGTIALRTRLTVTGDVIARVADQGRWREPRTESDAEPGTDGGIGLSLVTDLVDECRLEHDRRGTTATIRHHPWIAAQSPAAVDLAVQLPRRSAAPDPFLVLSQPSARRNRVRVDGPIDAQTAATLYFELRAATSSGTRDLTVDLTGTTHLASAGVAVLHRLSRQAERNHTELRLYAPGDSPAHLVMSLARLRHSTTDPDQRGDEPDQRGDEPGRPPSSGHH